MTEKEWLSSDNLSPMLCFLRDRASNRKLRLFACACCRRIWHLMADERCRRAVEVSEDYADGLVSDADLAEAGIAAQNAADALTDAAQESAYAAASFVSNSDDFDRRDPDEDFVGSAVSDAAYAAAQASAAVAQVRGTERYRAVFESAFQAEKRAQFVLLHDIMGNPFHPPPSLDPAWLAWNDDTVKHLAQAAYEHRSLPDGTLDGNRLAVLGDALEEAGCTDAELLAHLRSPGPHVRGCFALDAVLGKS